jgi:hypothetical protein
LARRSRSVGAALVVVATLAGCARQGGGAPDAERPFRLSFEDRPAPVAFSLEAPAVRDRPGGAGGLWAVVPGLPRPERARVVNLATGAEAVVALFAGGPAGIRLSNRAADALGIAAEPVPVRVTALRSRPSIATTGGRF